MSNFYDNAAAFIKKFEGYTSTAKWDVNHYRIGHGSDTLTLSDGTYRKVKKGDTTTKELAAKDLARRIKKDFEPKLKRQLGEDYYNDLPDPAKMGLLSLSYNYGSITHPEIITAAKTGNTEVLAKAMVESTKNDNKGKPYYEALKKRRKAEADYVKSVKGKSFNFFNFKDGSLDIKQVFIVTLVVIGGYVLYKKLKKK